jgi:hypothetical protein
LLLSFQWPGGLKAYDVMLSNELPIRIVKETVLDLLNGFHTKNTTMEREKIEQRIVTCLLMQCIQPEVVDDERDPFAGLFPEMSTTFLFELINSCHLEGTFVKVCKGMCIEYKCTRLCPVFSLLVSSYNDVLSVVVVRLGY